MPDCVSIHAPAVSVAGFLIGSGGFSRRHGGGRVDRGLGDVAQLGWLMFGLTGSVLGHWVAAFDGFA